MGKPNKKPLSDVSRRRVELFRNKQNFRDIYIDAVIPKEGKGNFDFTDGDNYSAFGNTGNYRVVGETSTVQFNFGTTVRGKKQSAELDGAFDKKSGRGRYWADESKMPTDITWKIDQKYGD